MLGFDLLYFLQALLAVTHVADVLATGLERLYQFQLGDGGREDRVDLFYAHTFRHLADGHGLLDAGAAHVQHEALEHLNTFLGFALGVGLHYLVVHADFHPGYHLVRRECLKALSVGHSERDIKGIWGKRQDY